MQVWIEHLGEDLLCRSENGIPAELRLAGEQATPLLEGWAKRYDIAVKRGDSAELLAVGGEMFTWLDNNGWASAWVKGTGPRTLEIRVDDPSDPTARAMLDAPWELLAYKREHLVDDAVQLFEVVRRIGAKRDPIVPNFSDLQLMFMAAAPEGQSVLDFEGEEAAILEATKNLPLHLVVEENGCAQYLGERLAMDGPFEALHLSCHGNIHPRRGHVLALEDETGALDYADAAEMVKVIGNPQHTPLVFLSACRTAEQGDGESLRQSEPFVRDLTRAGVANVLGWDGSVYDADAKDFAQAFYRELAGRKSIPHAAAQARLELRQKQLNDPRRGRHWHLARLYLGPQGGGMLAAKGLDKRRLAGASHEAQFLDAKRGEVPVAKRNEFVGRRRQAQKIMHAFREGNTGVLIHGMGNLGKSSLAARIAGRTVDRTTVVIFGVYDALNIFDRVVEAVSAEQRAGLRTTWREAIIADPTVLGEALETLLEGPLDRKPMLLIIDDLERILEPPTRSDTPTPVQVRYRPTLAAVLRVFARVQTASRLLLTSRYRFTLPDDHHGDLAAGLALVPLQPMDDVDRAKQLRAAARGEHFEDETVFDHPTAARALAVAGGNPGLQAVLMTPLFKGELEAARQAIAVIEAFQQTGAPPEELQHLMATGTAQDAANALTAFFQRMAFEAYRSALTSDQANMLSAAQIFTSGLPTPCPALQAVGKAADVADPDGAIRRLLDLGLFDDWGRIDAIPYAAANPLARPLAEAPDDETLARLAEAALPTLEEAWANTQGDFPRNYKALEIARLALCAPHPKPELLDRAAEAAARYLYNNELNARWAHDEIVQPTFAKLNQLDRKPRNGLLLIAYDCAERLGERATLDEIQGMMGQTESETSHRGEILLYQGRTAIRRGNVTEAERCFLESALIFKNAGDVREWAIAQGKIADILQARGELDEALRIRTQEQLPVYERLGDVWEKAVTQGKIADILQARGELDEALRIRTEEELPVYERLGDVRSKAVTQGQIADILQARGELDEALALQKERLPIAERLGDIDSIAHIKFKMATIRLQRGDHQRGELQQIYDDLAEAFALSRRLGRPDAIGHIGFWLAQVLAMAGHKDDALEVLQQAEEAFAKLGNTQGVSQVRELRELIVGT